MYIKYANVSKLEVAIVLARRWRKLNILLALNIVYIFPNKFLEDNIIALLILDCILTLRFVLWQGSLRKHKKSDEYVIPRGDWFSYVSCPHYLAEIVSAYYLHSYLNALQSHIPMKMKDLIKVLK